MITYIDLHNTIGGKRSQETPEKKNDRINLTIKKLSLDRTRLRKAVHVLQSKCREMENTKKELRRTIGRLSKKIIHQKIDFTTENATLRIELDSLKKKIRYHHQMF